MALRKPVVGSQEERVNNNWKAVRWWLKQPKVKYRVVRYISFWVEIYRGGKRLYSFSPEDLHINHCWIEKL